MEFDDNIMKIILARQKINILEKLIHKKFINIILEGNDSSNINESNIYTVQDLLEYIGPGSVTVSKSKPGIYPLITNLSDNNGIYSTIDTYHFEADTLFTIGRNNFKCFIQHGKIDAVKDVYVFKPKNQYNYELLQKILNEKLASLKNKDGLSIAVLKNIKLNIPIEVLIADKYEALKNNIENVYNSIENDFDEYYSKHFINNIDMIKFIDAFYIFTVDSSVHSINKPIFKFIDNVFSIALPNESISQKTMYFKPRVDYIDIEKTVSLMNEFIKFKDNINKDNIKNIKVPIFFMTAQDILLFE